MLRFTAQIKKLFRIIKSQSKTTELIIIMKSGCTERSKRMKMEHTDTSGSPCSRHLSGIHCNNFSAFCTSVIQSYLRWHLHWNKWHNDHQIQTTFPCRSHLEIPPSTYEFHLLAGRPLCTLPVQSTIAEMLKQTVAVGLCQSSKSRSEDIRGSLKISSFSVTLR